MKQYKEYAHESFFIALLLHATFLCVLFISFFAAPPLKKVLQKKKILQTPSLNAPVIFYTQKNSSQPTKIMQKTVAAATHSVKHPSEKNGVKKSSSPKTSEPKKTSKTNYNELHGSITQAKKDSETHHEKKTSLINEQESIATKKLSLHDLFKTLPHKEFRGTSDQEVVMVQGDMKHYTYLKAFIKHINDVFKFHGGDKQMIQWAQKGFIKSHAGMSVAVNKKGEVTGYLITRSTGLPAADELLGKTIEQSSPFPPLPEHYTQKSARIELISAL